MSVKEEVRKLAELRDILEERVKKLESELEGLRRILQFVDEVLLEKSFRRPELPSAEKKAESEIPPPKSVLKTITGEVLAEVYEDGRSMRIVMLRDFDINIPPFRSFLLDRVLDKMREKDLRAVDEGVISPEDALRYEIKTSGDHVREIVIENVSSDRKRELKSAIRWTLEKMFEKMST